MKAFTLLLIITGILGTFCAEANSKGQNACEKIPSSDTLTAGHCSVANMNLGDNFRCCLIKYDSGNPNCTYLEDDGDVISQMGKKSGIKEIDCISSILRFQVISLFIVFCLFL